MRIGIDAHVLGKNVGGVERFVRELVQQLPQQTPQHDYVVFVTRQQFAAMNAVKSVDNSSNARIQYVPLAFANPLLERLLLLPWLVQKYRLQALMVQRLAPWFCGSCQLIVAIHDLTPIKFPAAYKGISNVLVRLLTRNSIQRAALILTPTLAIKAEIERYCPTVKAPIHAYYNGVDSSAFSKAAAVDTTLHSLGIPAVPYMLTVGAIERRKNLETLHAMMPLLAAAPALRLVVVGGIRDQAYYDELQQQLTDMGLQQRVEYHGYMPEDRLIALYQHAALFISASKDEGFNIPPLEAMACGIPVVCSGIAVHQELFAGAAQFYETLSAESLAACVQLVLANATMRAGMVAGGHAKIAQYTWLNTATNVASAFHALETM